LEAGVLTLSSTIVEEYEGVELKFVNGKDAILTIFHDGKKQERVELSLLTTKSELHEMMVKKGFQRRSEEDILKIKEYRKKENSDEMKRRHAEKMIARKRRLMRESQQHKIKEETELRALTEEHMRLYHEATSRPVEQYSSAISASQTVGLVLTPSLMLSPSDEGKREEISAENLSRRIKSLSESRENFENRSENQMGKHEGQHLSLEGVRDAVPSEVFLAEVHIAPSGGEPVTYLDDINDEL
jgi:hypothetical protein